jgi:hypothetical protein
MKKSLSITFALTSLATTVPDDIAAHHAASGLYDRDGTITVGGRIESVFWRNPHVRFSLSVANEDGGVERWEIEAGSVNSLERMSVTEDVLTPGSFVEVTGLPGRDGEPIAYARSIVSAEGTETSMFFTLSALDEHYELERRDVPAENAAATDIFRVWVPITVPNTGAGLIDFPLTDRARAARASWDPANDPALNCVPPGMPAAMDNPYPIEFENRGDVIVLRLEEWDGVRTIYMRPDAANANREPSPMGYSVGRWDGTDLIVETTDISYPYFDDLGTPQTESLRITERFELDAENGALYWTGEIVDAEIFTEPVELAIEWRYIPGNARKRFDCAVAPGN